MLAGCSSHWQLLRSHQYSGSTKDSAPILIHDKISPFSYRKMHFWETVQRIGLKSCSYKHTSDWIYVNMASMSRYRSSAKYVLGTKNPISPAKRLGGCLRISLSSTIIVVIIVSRGLIVLAGAKGKQDTCQSKPLVGTAPYWKVFVKIDPYPSTVRVVPGLSACANQDGKPTQFLKTKLASGARRKPIGHVLTNSDRYTYNCIPFCAEFSFFSTEFRENCILVSKVFFFAS